MVHVRREATFDEGAETVRKSEVCNQFVESLSSAFRSEAETRRKSGAVHFDFQEGWIKWLEIKWVVRAFLEGVTV